MKMNLMVPAIICILLGGFLTFVAVKLWIKADSFKSYPVVKGEVVASELISRASVNRGSESRTAGFEWVLRAKYKYAVSGKEYDGERVSSIAREIVYYDKYDENGDASPPEYLQKMYDVLRNGNGVDVHYKESDPSVSFIFFEQSSVMRNLTFVILGLMLLIPGVILLRLALK